MINASKFVNSGSGIQIICSYRNVSVITVGKIFFSGAMRLLYFLVVLLAKHTQQHSNNCKYPHTLPPLNLKKIFQLLHVQILRIFPFYSKSMITTTVQKITCFVPQNSNQYHKTMNQVIGNEFRYTHSTKLSQIPKSVLKQKWSSFPFHYNRTQIHRTWCIPPEYSDQKALKYFVTNQTKLELAQYNLSTEVGSTNCMIRNANSSVNITPSL